MLVGPDVLPPLIKGPPVLRYHGGPHREREQMIDKARQFLPLLLVVVGVILLIFGVLGWLNLI